MLTLWLSGIGLSALMCFLLHRRQRRKAVHDDLLVRAHAAYMGAVLSGRLGTEIIDWNKEINDRTT